MFDRFVQTLLKHINQPKLYELAKPVLERIRRRPIMAIAVFGCVFGMLVLGAGCACATVAGIAFNGGHGGYGRSRTWSPNMNDNFYHSDNTDTTMNRNGNSGYISGDGFTYSWGD